jgi:hypothetical protein
VASMIDRSDLVYCDSWDARTRAAAGPLTPEAARQRERAGGRYAVVVLDHGRPTALVEMSSGCGTCTVWGFDNELRRAVRYELHRVGTTELAPSQRVQWHYPDRQRPEFDHATTRHTRRYSPDGLVHDIEEPAGHTGGSRHRFGRVEQWPVRYPLPRCGDAAALVHLADALAHPPAVSVDQPQCAGITLSPLVATPWRPPAPSEPEWLARMFDHGARLRLSDHREVTVEVGRAGQLRLPTGRLVAADAHALAAGVPFTVGTAPGRYPVSFSRLRRRDRPAPATVAAVRVEIQPGPVRSWELALRPYRDPCTLGSWQFFGFEVATGTACLADAAARNAPPGTMGDRTRSAVPPGQVVEWCGAGRPANVLAFPAAQGAYPTWLGRTSQGEVACYVADLLRAPDAKVRHG